MSEEINDRGLLWESFLKRWPIEDLPALTLQEYSQPGTQDSFTYWLESKTEKLGSIWGGSSFKFGIYERNNKNDAENVKGRLYGATYAWYQKYGDSPEMAFSAVHAEIIKAANAARQGNLAVLDEVNLGEAIKWKLAFLYQNRDIPCVLPIFKADYLRAVLGSSEKRVSILQCQTALKTFHKIPRKIVEKFSVNA